MEERLVFSAILCILFVGNRFLKQLNRLGFLSPTHETLRFYEIVVRQISQSTCIANADPRKVQEGFVRLSPEIVNILGQMRQDCRMLGMSASNILGKEQSLGKVARIEAGSNFMKGGWVWPWLRPIRGIANQPLEIVSQLGH